MKHSNVSIVIAYSHIGYLDAIGNDVLKQYDILQEIGFDVFLYAQGYDLNNKYKCLSLRRLFEIISNKNNILIYHHGNYWEDGEYLLSKATCQKVLRFHNITPPEYYQPYSYEIALNNSKGIDQTKRFITNRSFDLHMATSSFNYKELASQGVSKKSIRVIAPFNNIEKFNKTKISRTIHSSQIRPNQFNVLFVGRIAPHKGHFFLLDIIKEFVARYNHNICLNIIGGVDPKIKEYYEEFLKEIIKRQLSTFIKVHLGVSNHDLVSYYLTSHVFLVGSEHEGFCIPIIEAQNFSVPLIALDRTAVGDTVGQNQVVLSDKNPRLFAAALKTLQKNPEYRRHLAFQGYKNSRHFLNSNIKEAFLKAISKLIQDHNLMQYVK